MMHERPYSHLRASDADRERVAKFLREQHAVGRLDHDELEERLGRAYRAVTMGDLDRLIGDLPQPGRPAPRYTAPRPRRSPSPGRALLPVGLVALLAFAAPTAAFIVVAVMGALAIALLATVFAVGLALGPFLVVILLVVLAMRRRRPRRMHWRYH